MLSSAYGAFQGDSDLVYLLHLGYAGFFHPGAERAHHIGVLIGAIVRHPFGIEARRILDTCWRRGTDYSQEFDEERDIIWKAVELLRLIVVSTE